MSPLTGFYNLVIMNVTKMPSLRDLNLYYNLVSVNNFTILKSSLKGRKVKLCMLTLGDLCMNSEWKSNRRSQRFNEVMLIGRRFIVCP